MSLRDPYYQNLSNYAPFGSLRTVDVSPFSSPLRDVSRGGTSTEIPY